MLQWVVDAAQKIALLDEVIVATTTSSEDNVIEDWCKGYGIRCFRGPGQDVLKRYFDCAVLVGATHVVRLTSDCPFLDYRISAKVIEAGLQSRADYFFLDGGFPDGFDTEGFTFEALTTAHTRAVRKSDREHVTPYLRRHPTRFTPLAVELIEGLGDVRLTLDYPEDFSALVALLDSARAANLEICSQTVAQLLEKNPELLVANQHIVRNDGYLRSIRSD